MITITSVCPSQPAKFERIKSFNMPLVNENVHWAEVPITPASVINVAT